MSISGLFVNVRLLSLVMRLVVSLMIMVGYDLCLIRFLLLLVMGRYWCLLLWILIDLVDCSLSLFVLLRCRMRLMRFLMLLGKVVRVPL